MFGSFFSQIHTMLAEIKMDDMILPPASLFGTDQTVNPGHWAPPLLTPAEPTCLLQTQIQIILGKMGPDTL